MKIPAARVKAAEASFDTVAWGGREDFRILRMEWAGGSNSWPWSWERFRGLGFEFEGGLAGEEGAGGREVGWRVVGWRGSVAARGAGAATGAATGAGAGAGVATGAGMGALVSGAAGGGAESGWECGGKSASLVCWVSFNDL